jgi:hypothetical protein
MAEQKREKSEPESAQNDAPAEDEASVEKYPREQYIADSQRLVGHPSHVVAGALAETDIKAKSLTPKQVEQAVEKHLNREVEEA